MLQDGSFHPEDFGLTLEEVAAYEERSAARRAFAAPTAPLDAELQRRLLAFQETQTPYGISAEDLAEQEVLLSAVEDAMLRSLAQIATQFHR